MGHPAVGWLEGLQRQGLWGWVRVCFPTHAMRPHEWGTWRLGWLERLQRQRLRGGLRVVLSHSCDETA